MRKIKAIKGDPAKFKGQYEALMNCSADATDRNWDRAIEVMEVVEKVLKDFIHRDEIHFQPTHAREIARGATRDKWIKWVKACEEKKWTVRQLRAHLKIGHFTAVSSLAATGEYDVLVVDPPWPMEKIERVVRPNQIHFEYPTLSLDAIRDYQLEDSRRIPGLCSEHSHVFLWTTHKFLPAAFELLKDWELAYICCFVWHKAGGFQPIGLPQYNCEFALYARHGSPVFSDTTDFPVCFEAARREHSRKPSEFYETIKRATVGRRGDVFSREAHDGFDQIGNEVNKFAGTNQ